MGILPDPPFNFRQNCDHQPKSGDSCLKFPLFNLWPIKLRCFCRPRPHFNQKFTADHTRILVQIKFHWDPYSHTP
jgi:hypothetical protein